MAGTVVQKRRPYKNGDVQVIVKPGEEMPRGIFRMGWKLDPGSYGPGTMYFIITPDPDDVQEPPKPRKRRRVGTERYRA